MPEIIPPANDMISIYCYIVSFGLTDRSADQLNFIEVNGRLAGKTGGLQITLSLVLYSRHIIGA